MSTGKPFRAGKNYSSYNPYIKKSNFLYNNKKNSNYATLELVFHYYEITYSSLKKLKLSDSRISIIAFVFVVRKNFN